MKLLETERLILRPWHLEDAEDMFDYGKDPKVGPNAGWMPHQTLEKSQSIISSFIKSQEVYAIVHKEDNKVIGSLGLHRRSPVLDNQGTFREVGAVLHPAYWGQGIIVEAIKAVQKYAFIDLGVDELWCGHFDFNHQSKRVIEKCGFNFQFEKVQNLKSLNNKEVLSMYYLLTKEDYGRTHEKTST